MIHRPDQIGAFEFAVLASRRAEQLTRGCIPRVAATHKVAVTAQLEVIAGKVVRAVEATRQDLLLIASDPSAVEPSQAPGASPTEQPRDAPEMVGSLEDTGYDPSSRRQPHLGEHDACRPVRPHGPALRHVEGNLAPPLTECAGSTVGTDSPNNARRAQPITRV